MYKLLKTLRMRKKHDNEKEILSTVFIVIFEIIENVFEKYRASIRFSGHILNSKLLLCMQKSFQVSIFDIDRMHSKVYEYLLVGCSEIFKILYRLCGVEKVLTRQALRFIMLSRFSLFFVS